MHSRYVLRLALPSLVVALLACSSAGSTSPGGATSSDISRCKASCDKMKFFQCNSADEQARCYGDCDAATPSQIELFTGCADNSICDPQCRTRIQPPEKAKQGGGGASASTCTEACDKLVSCSLIPVGAKQECNTECSTKGYQYQIDCVNKTACDKLKSTCGGGGGDDNNKTGVASCQAECDSLNFLECASADTHATCRAKCASADASPRDTFAACSRSSGPDCSKKKACLDAFLK